MAIAAQPRAIVAAVAIGQADVEDDRIEMRIFVGQNPVRALDVRHGGHDEFVGFVEMLRKQVAQGLIVLNDQYRSPIRHGRYSPSACFVGRIKDVISWRKWVIACRFRVSSREMRALGSSHRDQSDSAPATSNPPCQIIVTAT